MYQSFYNLTGKPFRLSPDPSFFFPSRGHKRALAYLRYGLHQNEGFVVITGSPGIGKTTLAQILLNEMGEKNVVVAHLTTTQLEADDMLRMVSASFGLRYENLDKAALLKNIESYLLARSRENKRALLVIDEAQNLPMRSLEELRMLSNLQVGDQALLQTFLLGQVQFRNMLEDKDLEQLRQRVIANFHLGPLAADESQRYIESRLKHVGWDDDPAFAEIAFEKIHEYTEGVPRRINMLCDRILLFGCMEEQHNITGEVVDAVRAELEQEVGGAETTTSKSNKGDVTANSSSKKKTTEHKETNSQQPASRAASKSESKVESKKQDRKNTPSADASAPLSSGVTVKQGIPKNSNASKTPKGNRVGNRPEVNLPDSFTSPADDNEQFIDITQDFIDKFDESNSLANVENDSSRHKEIPSKKSAAKSEKRKSDIDKPGMSDKKETEKRDLSINLREDPIERESEEDVLGNTVTRKSPDKAHNEKDAEQIEVSAEPAKISERDLFRVIPGGKDNNHEQQAQAPTLPKVPTAPTASATPDSTPSSEDVVLRRILRLVLAFHRSPSSFPGLDDPGQPLPEGVSELLELAIADDEVLTKVSPAAVMGISPVMLRAAVRFFIRRTLFANEMDHFRMLGLSSNAEIADIERHYDLLMRLLRQDKQPGAAECVDKVGKSYESLMRFDDSPETKSKENKKPQEKKHAPSQAEDDKAAAVLEALENPELTIDFSDDAQQLGQQHKPKPVSAYVGHGTENYIPDPRITRRRVHLLGQAAILGIGALVIVLGIFITQLEPNDAPKSLGNPEVAENDAPTLAGETLVGNTTAGNGVAEKELAGVKDVEPLKTSKERRLGLSFNDGSSDTLNERFSEVEIGKESSSKPKVAFAGTSENKTQQKALAVKDTRSVNKPKVAASEPVKPVQLTQDKAELTKPEVKSETKTTAAVSAESFQQVPVTSKAPIETKKPELLKSGNGNLVTGNDSTSDKNIFQGKDIPIASGVTAASDSASQVDAETPIASTLSGDAEERQATQTQPVTQVAATDPVTSNVPSATKTKQITIEEYQLKDLLGKFEKSYDTGNVNTLMSLFAENSRTNTQTTKGGIEAEYKELFSTTASRNLTLIAPLWNNEGRFAHGVGQYSITIVPQGGEAYTSNGKYTIQAYLDSGRVKISRFYFSNEVTVSRKEAQAGSPGHTDLKNLLTNFTRFYENGDLNKLMSIFANNAQTNDQNTLAGIRKDHADLFNSTNQRQIFLKDVKWIINGKSATGNGNFEVMVQSKGQESFASVTGTITIEVLKSGKDLKITKFLHKSN